MSATARCALCDEAAPLRFRAAGHAVHRCGACDLEFVHPVPPPEAIAAVYAAGYFAGRGHGYADYFGAERAVSDAKAEDRLDRLAACGARPPGAVLDVGCADGRFLLAARARGYRVRGVEVSPEARAELPEALRGVVDGSLEEAQAHGPYDVITMWDVLEHLPDPLATLRAVRAMTTPGGLLGVVVPVIDNANARLWPRTWDQYKPPEHLWFFSRRALRAALLRACGAAVVHEASAWRREARVLDVARPSRGPLGRALRTAERAAWRTLARVRAIDPAWLDDSVVVVARVPRERQDPL